MEKFTLSFIIKFKRKSFICCSLELEIIIKTLEESWRWSNERDGKTTRSKSSVNLVGFLTEEC